MQKRILNWKQVDLLKGIRGFLNSIIGRGTTYNHKRDQFLVTLLGIFWQKLGLKITVFLASTPCSLLGRYRGSRGPLPPSNLRQSILKSHSWNYKFIWKQIHVLGGPVSNLCKRLKRMHIKQTEQTAGSTGLFLLFKVSMLNASGETYRSCVHSYNLHIGSVLQGSVSST